MIRGQKSIRNGIEDILFPMEYCNCTQGDFEGTHAGTYACDLAGKDTGIDPAFFPFSAVCKATNPNDGNAVWWQSQSKVRFADGTIDYCTIMVLHDNNLDGAYVGAKYSQGDQMAAEGTAGNATGNHLHIEIAKGPFTKQYEQNAYGVWHLPNNMPIEKACFVDNTILMNGSDSWAWKRTTDVDAGGDDDIVHIGDRVKLNGVFKVDSIRTDIDAVASASLANKPFAEYNYIDAGPCIETDSRGNKSGNQVLAVGEYFKVSGTFTILNIDTASDAIYVQIGNRKSWLKAGPFTKV